MNTPLDTRTTPTMDSSPSRPLDLDYPTLGRLVGAEADDLVQAALFVRDSLVDLTREKAGVDVIHEESDVALSPSPDELISRLNSVGSDAYRLARHVRTLVEFRAVYVARLSVTDGGR